MIDRVREQRIVYDDVSHQRPLALKKDHFFRPLPSYDLSFDEEGIVLSRQYISFYHKLRRQDVLRVALLQVMMEHGYVNFVRKPW